MITVRGEDVFDLTHSARTVSELMDSEDPLALVSRAGSEPRWTLSALMDASLSRDGRCQCPKLSAQMSAPDCTRLFWGFTGLVSPGAS